jgi:hypothetical protein
MTAFNVIKSLTKRGNAVIGTGCYAAALQSKVNDNLVIKIGNNLDDPWLDYYYNIITVNQRNSCVPKIASFFLENTHGYYVCTMEKLYMHDALEAKTSIAEYIRGNLTDTEWLIKASLYPKEIPDPNAMLQIMNKIAEQTCIMSFEDEEEYESTKRLDLHSGNILSRANGQLVITDPWCHTSDYMENIDDVSDWAYKVLKFCDY